MIVMFCGINMYMHGSSFCLYIRSASVWCANVCALLMAIGVVYTKHNARNRFTLDLVIDSSIYMYTSIYNYSAGKTSRTSSWVWHHDSPHMHREYWWPLRSCIRLRLLDRRVRLVCVHTYKAMRPSCEPVERDWWSCRRDLPTSHERVEERAAISNDANWRRDFVNYMGYVFVQSNSNCFYDGVYNSWTGGIGGS